ncbi:MAG: TetR/AcrR family transcriptional regulator [Bacteroidota bacterium]
MKQLIGKNEIINTALKVAKEKGWEKTSVREISKAINYSTIKIYSEFGSKDGLLRAIQEKGFMMLKNEYLRSTQSNESAEAKLIELTVAHYRFAIHQKTYYDLMFQMNGSTCSLPSGAVLQNPSKPINELLSYITGYKVDKTLFFHWWALAHGFVAITNAGKTKEEEAITMLRSIMKDFIKGIKK